MEFWTGYNKKPMGGGNPYYCCVGCGRTDPEINGSIHRHEMFCTEVARYLAEKNPTDTTDVVAVGEAYVPGETYEYEIISYPGSVWIFIERRNFNGIGHPLTIKGRDYPNLVMASEGLRDAVGKYAAEQILVDAQIPRTHVLWKLGQKG